MHILITGSTGLIGTRITELLGGKHTFIPLLQSEIDITDAQSVRNKIAPLEFDFLLHLAAYTNVDGAEQNKELCRAINVDGTQHLFEMAQEKKAKMIHISTDFVFDGKRNAEDGSNAEERGFLCTSESEQTDNIRQRAKGILSSKNNTQASWKPSEDGFEPLPCYTENSVPNPISHYGLTKYEAEQIVKDRAMIIRLSYPYRKEFAGKRDFVRTIRYLLEQGKAIQMVTDSLITPTFIDDIVHGLDYLITHYSPEVFHLVGADSMSPFDAGKMIAKTFGLNEGLVQPTTYAEYFNGKAARPQWAKIVNTNEEIRMKLFAEGLQQIL